MTWSKLNKDRTEDGAPSRPSRSPPSWPRDWPVHNKTQVVCEVRIITDIGTAFLAKDMIDEVKLSPVDATDLDQVVVDTVKGKLFTEQDVQLQALQLSMVAGKQVKQLSFKLDDRLRGRIIKKGKGVQYWIAKDRLHYYTIKEAS